MIMIVLQMFFVVFIAYSAFGGMVFFMQSRFLYRPVREVAYTPDKLGLAFEDVTLETSDGLELNSWYIRAEDAEFTVLLCHGNGGNIMHRLDSVNLFYQWGLNTFLFDYRGYGQSEGKVSEKGTYLDAMAAYEWLVKVKKVPPEKIILFGRSLGGAVAAQLAGKVEAKALVIESGFTSFVDMGKKFYPYMPVRLLARYNYGTIDYLKDVCCPVMIIHSRDDEIVPFEFGLKLYEAANEPSRFVEIFGGHNDGFLVSAEIYKKAWGDWVKFLEGSEDKLKRQIAS